MKITLKIILLLGGTFCNGQNQNYCEIVCHLPKDHEVHFDPYYNEHLCENFNPKQADFSKEYLNLQTQNISKAGTKVTEKVSYYSYNLKSLFNTPENHQNGIIGLDYKRIKIHIYKTEIADGSENSFLIYGKSNVNGNICDFTGNLKIINIYEITENFDFPGQAQLFAEYEFYEDSLQKHSGIFKGTFECSVKIDHGNKEIELDDSFAIADGYFNRTYVGTWTGYDKKIEKKCIWGDYRLPFTFDFDCGDGEMRVCEKYEKNGWTSFNNAAEPEQYYKNGKFVLTDKWWKK